MTYCSIQSSTSSVLNLRSQLLCLIIVDHGDFKILFFNTVKISSALNPSRFSNKNVIGQQWRNTKPITKSAYLCIVVDSKKNSWFDDINKSLLEMSS